MKGSRQVDYPAIAKAQRLTAERLGGVVARTCPSAGNTGTCAMNQRQQESQRSANEHDHAAQQPAAITMQEEERQHGRTPSPPLLWVWDTGTARAAARNQHCDTNKKIATAVVSPTDDNQRGRKKTCRGTRSRSRRRDAGQGRWDGAVSRSPSCSPPPPPPRLGEDTRGRKEETKRSTSLERTLKDIHEISSSVREEAEGLDQFLSLEVAPVAQKVLDAAVAQHAKARRLLSVETPRGHLAALDGVNDSSVASHNGRQQQSGRSRSPVRGRTANDTNGGSNARVAAPETSYASTHTTEAWRRAVRAGVIQVGPPPAASVCTSLPVRDLVREARALATAIGVAGNSASRRNLGGDKSVERKKAVQGRRGARGGGEGELGGGERSKEVPMGAGGGTAAVAATVGRGDVEVEEEPEGGEESDSEKDDEAGDISLSRQVTADISAKIVGLSSLIRRKAAEASAGRRRQPLKKEAALRRSPVAHGSKA